MTKFLKQLDNGTIVKNELACLMNHIHYLGFHLKVVNKQYQQINHTQCIDNKTL